MMMLTFEHLNFCQDYYDDAVFMKANFKGIGIHI